MSLIDKVFIITGAAITFVGVALLFLDKISIFGWPFLNSISGDAGLGSPAY